jgi:hypothetical protein
MLRNPHTAADSGRDRRKSGRVRIEGFVCSRGRVLDLSATGLRFKSTFFAPVVGDLIHLVMQTPDGDMPVTARVAWIKRTGLISREVGAEFAGLSQQARASLLRLASAGRIDASRAA